MTNNYHELRKEQLRSILKEIMDPASELVSDSADVDRRFRESFILYGSETDDNVNAMQHIQVSACMNESGPVFGLNLVPSCLPLSLLSNGFEELELPDHVRLYFPTLTESEWSAFTRIITILLTLLERRL